MQSRPETHPYYRKSFRPQHYELDIGHEPDTGALAGRLAGMGVARVVAGTESGVELADRLSALMGLPGNDPELAAASADKELMLRLARDGGVPVPAGSVFTSAEAAVRWFRESGLRAAIAKPVASAGTDNVRFCVGERDLAAACEQILTGRNVYGEANDRVIVEERVVGTEYFVDTVSREGRHQVAEVWRYTKRRTAAGAPMYDHQEPVPVEAPEWPALKKFVGAALDVLGIRATPAHTEVMLTCRGPVLIETGARLCGGTLPEVVERYCGMSQTELFARTLVDGEFFDEFSDETLAWTGAVRLVDLCNTKTGVVTAEPWEAAIRSLPTFVAMTSALTPGAPIAPTTSLLDSPGYVYLAADEIASIERDYRQLRTLEDQGLYTQ